MKVAFQVLIFTLGIIISLTGIREKARTTTYGSWEIAQSSGTTNKEQLLEVAVPSSAIVRLKQEGSYTGELIAFNSTNLMIKANGFSETVPLSQIKEVEFQGNIWIETPAGTRKRVPIRGLTIPLEAVPVTAFNLGNPPNTAMLNLERVLSQEEFERLSNQTNRVHVVKKILFESSETMTIRIVGARGLAN